ncbi:MAG: sensor histidine kinase [Anaeromassilibacillus sp.]|nr:sensor histidine kinase [Anaeromassilibacillus sp.]MDY3778860.1 sensor histidine kinase [Candidatus Limousia pullorum]
MKFLISYLNYRKKVILVFLIFAVIFSVSFALYHLPLGAVLYPLALCLLVALIFVIRDFNNIRKTHKDLEKVKKLTVYGMEFLPEAKNEIERDYGDVANILFEENKQIRLKMEERYNEMIDYYTMWAHQIKTPIAAMRLNLQNEDSDFSRRLTEDLQRIEQYVEMVLCYLRLDSNSSDYVIREYDIDGIVRQGIKKFASQFIRKKIKLDYRPSDLKVVTDEKWLLFVIEQVLSNSLKYTKQGSISVFVNNNQELCIKDTGIGIAPEDLPRIFENGYTGYNGRNDKKASGIGLYLCKRICKNLGHEITASSVLGEGTTIKINLNQKKIFISD